MKKYFLYTFLGATALFLTLNLSSFKAAEKEGKYILVEIYEVPSYNDKGIHIHWGNGKTEIVPFKELTAEHHDDNGDLITKTLNGLVEKGYEIDHVAAGLAQSGMITKVFLKK